MTNEELILTGERRIRWAERHMPVLASIARRWEEEKPLTGLRIGACLHVTTETANLVRVLKTGGAEVALCASNPLSTQDDVAAALNQRYGIPTFAVRGEDDETYYRHIHQVLDTKPHITMDDGADLISTLHRQRQELLEGVMAGTEETTTGVIRLRAMAEAGVLRYPVIAVNDALTKHMFDNRYGTGQSAVDGIIRATNYLLAGSTFVVVGYGWCGRGVAARAQGLGAKVIVVEVDPLHALEAAMDGYPVTDMQEAARLGDIFCTVTGNRHVIDEEHLRLMKDGAILANAGHFDVEINLEALRSLAASRERVRENVEEFRLADGRRLYLLAGGRLVNLAAAEGHPAQVMDMSFANQALAVGWLYKGGAKELQRQVYRVPEEIDRQVAALKLASMGIKLEKLTSAQEEYLRSWQAGT
ncbi:MAG: adenosylhomocysteinase [Clostridia bacterium]|jgi:adenosylhomocysteinase|nr:adenosylhomocysteinase [Clostridia bacterium]